MVLFVFTLLASTLLVQSSRRQQQKAAAAIQHAVFGARGEPEFEVMAVSDTGEQVSPLRKKGGKPQSYSLAKLSSMNVKAATRQKSFYRPERGDNLPIIESCQAVKCHLNIAIMMDSSGSVGHEHFQTELGFVRTLLEILSVKAHEAGVEVCTGIISYSTNVRVDNDPCCENSMCSVVGRFGDQDIGYMSGSTNTAGALKVARQMLQAPASYKKVALLITDGKSNTGGDPVEFATQMRLEDEVTVVALGVTNSVNTAELQGITGIQYVTKISEFDEFRELASLLLEANSVGDESDLDTSFASLCRYDDSAFRLTCAREEEEEEEGREREPLCSWGAWSNCIERSGTCYQHRTCKLYGSVSDRDKRRCECRVEALRVQGGLGRPRPRHPNSRGKKGY